MKLDELLKKYSLPSKEQLEQELGELNEEYTLIEVIKELREKIGKYMSFLEHLLQPESDMVQLGEAGRFSDREREHIYQLLCTLLAKHREYYHTYLTYNADEHAQYCKDLFALWQEKKEQVRKIVLQALQAWDETQTLQEAKQSYLG